MNAESVIKAVSSATGLAEPDCARLTSVASGLAVSMVSVQPRPECIPLGSARAAGAPTAGTSDEAPALTPQNLVDVIARTANVDPAHAAHALRAVAAAIQAIATTALAAAAK
ncbi:MAG: hypothetical protein KGI67_02925 [Pseudomonadota bacterium]|nr:hypothetical protein [Pseudomonadota bacterium]